jgi:hypothetical protein
MIDLVRAHPILATTLVIGHLTTLNLAFGRFRVDDLLRVRTLDSLK